MRMRPMLCAAALAASLLLPSAGGAQSVLNRTPNLSGGWVGQGGTVYFNFMHRFHKTGDINKIVNWPGFLLSYSFANLFMAGGQYTSFSRLDPADFNEYEWFLRFAPLAPGQDLPFSAALTGAYNTAAESFDGELALGVPVGRATFHGALRAFSDLYGAGEARMAVGAGLDLSITDHFGLAGDIVTPLSKRDNEEYAWGAALQFEIPNTPHSFSLQVANTNSSTLQGSSSRTILGRTGPRWGFEFTVPITLSRYFGSGGGADVTITADTARVAIRDFEFAITRLVIRPGTTVVWVNEGNVAHTSTADSGAWNSPMLSNGESYSRVFNDVGEFSYYCAPHPFMRAAIVVQAP